MAVFTKSQAPFPRKFEHVSAGKWNSLLKVKEILELRIVYIFYDAQSSLVSESAVQQRKSGLTRGFLLPQLMTKNVCTSAEWYRTIRHDESQSVS